MASGDLRDRGDVVAVLVTRQIGASMDCPRSLFQSVCARHGSGAEPLPGTGLGSRKAEAVSAIPANAVTTSPGEERSREGRALLALANQSCEAFARNRGLTERRPEEASAMQPGSVLECRAGSAALDGKRAARGFSRVRVFNRCGETAS